jgi:uncharacterized protein (TIGR03435 family)
MSAIASGAIHFRVDDAQVDLGGVDLSTLIQLAYGLPPDQISGPGWLEEEPFSIMAKLPAGASKSQVPEMLQTMLAERFKMTVHHEEKVRPVYLLEVGKGPLKLKESKGDNPGQDGCQGEGGGYRFCQNVTMEQFAEILSQGATMSAMAPVGTPSALLDRPVVDETELKGGYDFSLEYGRVGAARVGRGGNSAPTGDGATLVPISDAVKALGLVLKPGRHTFDILVIDHVERVPSEN